jgi:hypothetical protein
MFWKKKVQPKPAVKQNNGALTARPARIIHMGGEKFYVRTMRSSLTDPQEAKGTGLDIIK